MDNLKKLGLAMDKYAEKHGSFPPAYTADASGRRLHSWRVLLLPFLGQERLYKQLRLDEPWDSLHNLQVFAPRASPDQAEQPKTLSCFRCPSDPGQPGETNYVMIVGPQTISAGGNCVRQEEITDGLSKTICVVETVDTGIRWYEPRDLDADKMSYRISEPKQYCISSRHPGGAQVLLCDGAVRFLSETLDSETLRALTTINGGEKLPPNW